MARQPGQSCTGGPDCQSLGAEGRAGFARLGGLAGRGRAGGFGFRIWRGRSVAVGQVKGRCRQEEQQVMQRLLLNLLRHCFF